MAIPNDRYRLTGKTSPTGETADFSADIAFDVLRPDSDASIAGVYAIGDPLVAALNVVAALSVVGNRDQGCVALYWERGDESVGSAVMAALRDVESMARHAIDSLEGRDPDPQRHSLVFWHDAVDL